MEAFMAVKRLPEKWNCQFDGTLLEYINGMFAELDAI